MSAERACRKLKLKKQPLALVLIQTRFSPVSNMAKYIHEIQDGLRRSGFPFFRPKTAIKLDMTQEGPKISPFDQWVFESADRYSSVIIDASQVSLQTTCYDSFEAFAEHYLKVLYIAMKITEHATYGVPVRLGLRYVDQVSPQYPEDTVDSYLNPSLRGMETDYFKNQFKNYSFATVGDTSLQNSHQGKLSIRILRNPGKMDLPPDLMDDAPPRMKQIDYDKDFALIDMDHGCEGPFGKGIDIEELEALFYAMHDVIIEVFFSSVISKEGIEKWK